VYFLDSLLEWLMLFLSAHLPCSSSPAGSTAFKQTSLLFHYFLPEISSVCSQVLLLPHPLSHMAVATAIIDLGPSSPKQSRLPLHYKRHQSPSRHNLSSEPSLSRQDLPITYSSNNMEASRMVPLRLRLLLLRQFIRDSQGYNYRLHIDKQKREKRRRNYFTLELRSYKTRKQRLLDPHSPQSSHLTT